MEADEDFTVHIGKDEEGWFADFGRDEKGDVIVSSPEPAYFLALLFEELCKRVAPEIITDTRTLITDTRTRFDKLEALGIAMLEWKAAGVAERTAQEELNAADYQAIQQRMIEPMTASTSEHRAKRIACLEARKRTVAAQEAVNKALEQLG